MSNKAALNEIRRRVLAVKRDVDTSFIARYVGSVGHEKRAPDEQSRMKFLGLGLSEMREITRGDYSFSSEPFEKQMAIWAEFFHEAKSYDEQNIAVNWFADRKRRSEVAKNADLLFGLQASVDNWAISDTVAETVAHALEHNPNLYSRFEKWNRSALPWERRQSVVGLYCYARLRKKHFPAKKALVLIERLLDDPHYFVQKGVGWALREIYQVDRDLQNQFLDKHLGRISGIAFAAAAEKYPPRERAKLIERRKALRKARG